MDKNVTITNDVKIKSSFNSIYVNLSWYAKNNIPNYGTITEIPKEHMDYINSVKYANNCYSMFYDCNKLTAELDLSNFDTSKVTNMGNMFYNCTSLISIDVSNFDTSSVTDMSCMFYNCVSLIAIKGTLDLSSCTTVNSIFNGALIIEGLHLKNVPRSLLDTDGSLKDTYGILNHTYIIDNILEDK